MSSSSGSSSGSSNSSGTVSVSLCCMAESESESDHHHAHDSLIDELKALLILFQTVAHANIDESDVPCACSHPAAAAGPLDFLRNSNKLRHTQHQPIDGMLRLLRLGADVNRGQFMLRLVSNQRLDLLQQLYERAPDVMLDVDYSIRVAAAAAVDADESRSRSQRYETIIERYETIIGWAESKAEAEAKLKLERHSHSKSLITRKAEEEEESQRSASVSASASESASTWPHVRIDACQDVDIESSNNATTAENRDGHTEHEPMKQTETLTATAREVVALLKKERDRLMNLESIIQTHRQMQTNNNSNNNAESDVRPAAAVTVTVQPRHDPPGPVGPIGPGLEEKMKTKMQVSESHGNDHGDEQCHHGIEDGMLSIHDDMTSVSTSASHSPHGRVFQHACHNEDDSELQRRIGRRVFTSRLLRNIHKWSTYIVDEAKIEFIGRVALMFIEECKRPTEQSLIDLSQTDDGGCDVVQGFCHYYARAISCNSNNTSIVAILYTIIWPRLVELIRHQQYDINRQDKFGWSALTLLICDSAWCGAPKHKYELMESLLALGANPNQRGGQSPVYGHGGFYHEPLFAVGDPPLVYFASLGMDEMEGIELLLRYGADIHATNAKGETFMHALVSHKQLDSLRHLYSHHSTIMVTFDYTVSSYVPKLNPSGGTLFRIIDDTRLGSSLRQIDGLMFDLLNAARNKQRERFRRCLLQRTSMPSDLIGVIIDYVTPKDWKDLLHRPSDHDVKSDDEEQEDDGEDEWWR